MTMDAPARATAMLSREEIADIHRKEWQAFRATILLPAASSQDPDAAKFAKDIAQAIKLAQESERAAWHEQAGTDDSILEIRWMGESQVDQL